MSQDILYFIYGLVGYTLGMSMLLQYRRAFLSQLPLAQPLKWLGLFGLTHGLSEWFIMAWLLGLTVFNGELLVIKQLFTAASYLFLTWFGSDMMHNMGWRWGRITKKAAVAIFLLWAVAAVLNCGILGIEETSLLQCQFIYNYGLGLPGALLSSAGLLKWSEKLARDELNGFWHLRVIAWLFIAFGLFSSILIDKQVWFPVNIINHQNFTNLTGIPVELIRLIILAALTVLFLQAIQIFIWEKIALLTKNRAYNVALEERQRINRDLHDFLVQDLFALSLQLEKTKQQNEPVDVNVLSDNVNQLLLQSRNYIHQQHESTQRKTLEERLRDYISTIEDRVKTNIYMNISPALVLRNITSDTADNIFYIIQEAVTNAIKHSGASVIKISTGVYPAGIRIIIADNGKWAVTSSESGVGLNLVRQRAENINALIQIQGSSKGTRVVLTLPWKKGVV